ncbi:MAG: hypothetical protein M3137_06790 [Actinomycetota bacterium]|nr:hypothetical protein [Actinomycetota bacterium]
MIVGVVISNLLYVIVALTVAVIGALIVVLRHRKPKSVEANVASFHRGLRALAPDQLPDASGRAPSWGGASRRAATVPSSARRSTDSVTDAVASPPGGGDEADAGGEPGVAPERYGAETDARGGPVDEVAADAPDDTHDAGALHHEESDSQGIAGESIPDEAAAGSDEVSPAAGTVHLTSRTRRPSSPAGRTGPPDGETEVSTEEAETG